MAFLPFREPVSTLTHALALLAWIPGTAALCRRAAGERGKQAALAVFGLGLAACYGASAAFHAFGGPDGGEVQALRRLDHIAIFALIAGTYTPIAATLLRGRARSTTLILVWLAAAAGAGMHLASSVPPRWAGTLVYLAMGWGSVLVYGEVARVVPLAALRPVWMGGVLYSVGAGINLAPGIEPWPGVVGAHEIFHVLVVAASGLHFRFMATVVLPFGRVVTPAATRASERIDRAPAARPVRRPSPARGPGQLRR